MLPGLTILPQGVRVEAQAQDVAWTQGTTTMYIDTYIHIISIVISLVVVIITIIFLAILNILTFIALIC